jgi:hypothetical protein
MLDKTSIPGLKALSSEFLRGATKRFTSKSSRLFALTHAVLASAEQIHRFGLPHFEPSTVYLESLVSRGALGRLDAIHTSFSEIYNPKIAPGWLLDSSLAGGGPMMDLGVYCVNTSRWLAGEDPKQTVAHSWRHGTQRFKEVKEGVNCRLDFPSGLVVQGT